MPNYIKNKLEFIGEHAEQIKAFLLTKHEKNSEAEIEAIDFNNIMPMPEELNIESGSLGSTALNALFEMDDTDRSSPLLAIFTRESKEDYLRLMELKPTERIEAIKLGIQYYKNIKDHGYATWYQWCSAKWGTKWNAMEPRYLNSNTIAFSTAWSGVIDLILILSKKFTNTLFNYSYADEDSGYNCQKLKIKDGVILESFKPEGGSKEAMDLYFELWPERKEDYKLVNNQYEFVEE
jgi:hypothetical protein